METERKNNNLKTRQALDLPKIDQQTYLKTIISPQQRRVIQISDEFSKKNRFTAQSETTKNPKMESSENPKTSKLYFFKQQLSSTMKKYTSHSQSSEVNAKNFLSFSKTHQTDYDLWKKEELKKIKDSKDSKDLANDLILSDKIIRKNTIMNPSLFMKSNLAQIDFNKLSQKSIQKLPKAEISSEKIKENLKEYIGINKYPIDYKEVNLDIPKSNFIEFELLKTHMSNFIVNYEKSKFISLFSNLILYSLKNLSLKKIFRKVSINPKQF